MRKLKTIRILVLFSIIFFAIQTAVFCKSQEEINIPITVKELNGMQLNSYFTRRGIPLPEGACSDISNLKLVDSDNNEILSEMEVLETYSDGSIKWFLTCFSIDLRPNELKCLYIKERQTSNAVGDVKYSKDGTTAVISNSKLNIRMGAFGIESLKFNSAEMLSDGGINMYARIDGNMYYLKADEISVVKNNDLYVKIKAKGDIIEGLEGEYILTISSDNQLVDIEYRVNAKKNFTIQSLGIDIDPKCMPSREKGVFQEEILKAGAMNILSHDNIRFLGAATREVNTGFVIDDRVKVAPIINNTEFIWYDGVTRTNHMYISFGDTEETYINLIKNPPAITIDSEQFVKAGLLETTETCAPVDRMIEGIVWLEGKLGGIFDAGSIPYRVDMKNGVFGTRNTRPGEMEYHVGYAYMMTGSKTIYNMLCESAETWADTEVYKGGHQTIVGANRYKTGDMYGLERYFTSHPFYGDPSGLYMAYILSGNEYIGDIFKTCVDYISRSMHEDSNFGENMPRMYIWSSGQPIRQKIAECRYMKQARAQFLAYNLFKDEKYKQSLEDIISWGKKTQMPGGYWHQAYNNDGSLFIQSGQRQAPVKNYVMLYGFRGISDSLDFEMNPEAVEITLKFADYLCSEVENYGKGIWQPCGNKDLYPSDEDGGRGKSAKADIMATDVLYQAYKISGDERHLNGMLAMLEAWLCEQAPGGVVLDANYTKDCSYGGGIGTLCGGMNYTLFKIAHKLIPFIEANAEKICELGYEDLVIAFAPDSKVSDTVAEPVKYVWPEINENIYRAGDDEVLLGYNVNGHISGDYTKDYETKINKPGLWQGMLNRVSSVYETILYQHMEHFDLHTAIKRPIFVENLSDDIEININKYNSEEIIFTITGKGKARLRIENGKFNLNKNGAYNIDRKAISGGFEIKISNGNSYTVDENSNLTFDVNFDKDITDIDKTVIERSSLLNENVLSSDDSSFIGANDFAHALKRISGQTVEFPRKTVTYEEAAKEITGILALKNPEFLSINGILKSEFIVPKAAKSTEEALNNAIEVLELDNETPLAGNIELPEVSLHNANVNWRSDNEDILDSHGILKRENVGETESVKLTATVELNGLSKEKEFDVKLKLPSEIMWQTRGNFKDGYHRIYPKTGDFTWEFTLVPMADQTNALTSITDSDLPAAANTDWPVIVRCNPNGYLDAYNYSSYQALAEIKYKKNVKYNIRVEISTDECKYDVYVTPEGEEEILLAKDFRFRNTAGKVKVFDATYLIAATSTDECFWITKCNLTYPANEPLREFQEYDENGLLFGKYVSDGNILTVLATSKGKINWVSDVADVVGANGVVISSDEDIYVKRYGVPDSENREITFKDLTDYLSITDKEDVKDSILTVGDAKKILRKLLLLI